MYATSQLQAVSMVNLSPTISFKLQIDQFGQEFAKLTLVRNPIISIRTRVRFGQESASDKSPLRTRVLESFLPFFLQFSHPQIQILARHGKKWAQTNVVSFTLHIYYLKPAKFAKVAKISIVQLIHYHRTCLSK